MTLSPRPSRFTSISRHRPHGPGISTTFAFGIKFNANFNGDANVNGLDLTAIKSSFGINAGGDADGDLDTDGNDLLIWQRQLGPIPASTAVPEPSTIGMLGSAVIALACRGLRKRRGG